MRRACALLLAPALLAGALMADVIDGIAAVVNDRVITVGEVEDGLAERMPRLREAHADAALGAAVEEERERIVRDLIDRELVVQAAEASGAVIPEADLDQAIDEDRAKFASEEEFRRQLEAEGLTLTRLRELHRREKLQSYIRWVEVLSKIEVNPAEVDAYYSEHLDQFTLPARVRRSRIFIPIEPGSDGSAAKAAADAAYQRVSSGEDFAAVAREVSRGPKAEQGGDWGFTEEDKLPVHLRSIEVGRLSEIIKSDAGYSFIIITARRKPEVKPLDEVRGDIDGMIRAQNAGDLLERWMGRLRAEAYIERIR